MPALGDGTNVWVGPHLVSREGPITRVEVRGVLSVEETKQLLAHYTAMLEEQGFVLILMEVHAAGGMDMNARRLASDWGGKHGGHVRTAVCGAPFVLKTGIGLMNRAAALLKGKAPAIVFTDTYEEARDWLLAPETLAELRRTASRPSMPAL